MRTMVVEWKCDKVACGVVTYTNSWDELPPGWWNKFEPYTGEGFVIGNHILHMCGKHEKGS